MTDQEPNESLPQKARRKAKMLAIAGLMLVCVYCLAFYTEQKPEKPSTDGTYELTNVQRVDSILRFNKVLIYPITDGSIDEGVKSSCKDSQVLLVFKDSVVSLSFQPLGPNFDYKIISIFDTPVGLQYVFQDKRGAFSAVTPINNDSTLVMHTGTHLIIFNKGNKCLSFNDLPIPN